jgi:MscS family membrane protein
LICAAKSPLTTIIWRVAVKFCINIINNYAKIFNADAASPIYRILIILCFSWFLILVIKNISKDAVSGKKIIGKEMDQTTIDALSKLCRLIVVVITILIIMQDVGFNISGILAAGGVGGLVIGFAAKDLIANFFGGLTIYLDRPFVVGDWIRCEEKKVEGVVEYIGWRHTRIRALNKNPIYVPNGFFTTVVVENPSRMSHRRIDETIVLCDCDSKKITLVTAQIAAMLDLNPQIDHDQVKLVNFEHFNELGLEIRVYAFTKNIDLVKFKKFKQEILLQISEIITQNGAQIALSNKTLFVSNDQY